MGERIGGFAVEMGCEDGRAVVRVIGEVDLGTADELDHVLSRAVLAGAPVVVDLHGTTYIDSTGLAVLVNTDHHLRAAGRPLVLRDPSPRVRRVLDLTGLTEVLAIETS